MVRTKQVNKTEKAEEETVEAGKAKNQKKTETSPKKTDTSPKKADTSPKVEAKAKNTKKEAPKAKEQPKKKKVESESDDNGDDEDVASGASSGEETTVAATNGTSPDSKKRKVETTESTSPKKIKIETDEIYFGNIPYDSKLEDYKPIFEEAGKIDSIDWKTNTKEGGKFRGFCYVKYTTSEAGEKAVKNLNGREVQGRALKVEKSQGLTQNPPAPTVFVGGIPSEATSDEIKGYFSKFGSVKDIRLVNDRKTGAWKGTTFIDFEDVSSATKAYNAGPHTLRSKELRIDYASPLTATPVNRGGRGGGGRGGRGGAGGRGGRGGMSN